MSPARKLNTPYNKKRKASALQDETESAVKTPNKRSASASKQSRRGSQARREDEVSTDDLSFTVECPAKAPKARKSASTDADDVFRQREEHDDIPALAIDYAIRPGSKWMGMRSYRNVKLSNQVFSTGSIIYINRHNPAPSPPPESASPETLLSFDRKNLWVGRVLECRAASDRYVFLRIFWLYWPEELPMGRQSYHGAKELVMSNAMDIIDATSIASEAEVSHWDESNDDGDAALGERFWRQTFNVAKLGKLGKGGLSVVKRHCVCSGEYNPDATMYKCVNEKCGIWNHQECLVEDVLEKTYKKFIEGTLDKEDGDGMLENGKQREDVEADREEPNEEQQNPKSPSALKRFFPTERLGELASTLKSRIMTPDTVDSEGKKENEEEEEESKQTIELPTRLQKRKKPQPGPKPWDGKLSASIEETQEGEDDSEDVGRIVARIVEMTGDAIAKQEGKKKGKMTKGEEDKDDKENKTNKEWVEDVCCLNCGRVLE